MKKLHQLFISAAMLAIPFTAGTAAAETVVTETVTQAPPPGGGRIINLNEFDLNMDNILSSMEVGEMLFRIFDTDSNTVIDSAEYERRGVLTVVPMEKTTVITYDYNNDGLTDRVQRTYETFMQDTQLARFDANKDGLSPREFLDRSFFAANVDGNTGVDLNEWRNAYISRLVPEPMG
jgi:hypothetical protein